MKKLLLFVISSLLLVSYTQEPVFNVTRLNSTLSTANSWVINNVEKSSEVTTTKGITNWKNSNDTIRTFFYTEDATTIPFGIIAKTISGTSEIAITFNNTTEYRQLSNTSFDTIYLGNFTSTSKGYQYFDLQGVTKSDNEFAEIKSFVYQKPQDSTLMKYLKDEFYFGRRGPSTHLVFETPTNDIEWMYSEIEIEKGEDIKGSYFMANGFGEGYFGIQVNSDTERRILFSIWSPFKTDDPTTIPDNQKIKLLNKGEGVSTGEFGNEGSGGQSYKVFNWKSEKRYGFLTRVHPNDDNTTDYTAFFFDPDTTKWHLIASFKRPSTDTYVTRPYSFLENFIPNTGALTRTAGFYNQWMRDSKGKWYEISEAKFSADATAKKGARLDYAGGNVNDGFFLKSCGFTNDNTAIGTILTRPKQNISPNINFKKL